MERKIVMVMPNLTAELKACIESEAVSLGFVPYFFKTPEDAEETVKDAEILFGNVPGLCAHASGLKWMCTANAGVEPYLKPGVLPTPETVLTNSSGAYGVTIAEHIVMVTLEMMRREAEYREIVKAHTWKRDLKISSIYDSRITMLGTGDIGRKAAVRLRGFGPKCIVGISRSGRRVPEMDQNYTVEALDRILPETDLLIMSLPGTQETMHIMNEARLRKLPETAYLVNVGRGNAIDQAALEQCLRGERLAGAALDVFETEPVPADASIWSCPHLHITPHTAGNMTLTHTVRFIVEQFLTNLQNYAAGRPMNAVVDRQMGY
ncbi:MAG: D-2-hydroxyacid dehydrogenase [Clostridia bacterium]|nr:D-2-hydroxyacid dehydrogenase [Clostridia bacterium]